MAKTKGAGDDCDFKTAINNKWLILFLFFLFTEDLFVWLDTYIVILTHPVF